MDYKFSIWETIKVLLIRAYKNHKKIPKDSISYELIKEWQGREYLNDTQKKACLQVAINDLIADSKWLTKHST